MTKKLNSLVVFSKIKQQLHVNVNRDFIQRRIMKHLYGAECV